MWMIELFNGAGTRMHSHYNYIIMFNLQGLSGISKMYQVPELKVVHELG